MTPRTRSGGAASPSSIIYKSTPTLRQTQFPARRRRVRTYGKRSRRSLGGDDEEAEEDKEGGSAQPTPNLKQKTLTQYDFASSSFDAESVVELSDASDVEKLEKVDDTGDAEKENNVPKGTKRRRSAATTRAPLHPILDLEEERVEEEKGEEELRVPDTEAEEEEEEDGDEGPILRGRRRVGFTSTAKAKRRRTLGEEHRMSTMKKSKTSRRRTLGDSPVAGPSASRYHTQTLTQFIGRKTSFVADSDDEELGDAENDGFLEWLGAEEDEPQSPSMGTQASKRAGKAVTVSSPAPVVWEDNHSPSPRRSVRRARPATTTTTQTGGDQSREESVVPQTPIKSIRFNLPPSAQHMITSPSPTRMAAIYGAPNTDASPSSQRQKNRKKKQSPLKPLAELTGQPRQRISSPAKKPELVIEDSYATDGWSSVGGTQARLGTPSQTQTDVFSTPAEEMAPQQPPAAGSALTSASNKKEEKEDESPQTQSHDEQVEEQQFYGALSQIVPDSAAVSQQLAPVTPKKATRSTEEPAVVVVGEEREIPDSDEEEVDFGAESDDAGGEADESRFAAGAETQLLMDQLQSSVRKWSGMPRAGHASSSSVASPHAPRTSSPVPTPGSAATPASAPPSSSLKPLTTTTKPKQQQQQQQQQQQPPHPAAVTHDIPITHHRCAPLRKPLHRPQEPLDTQGLPLLESQRVALATLQGFTPASARTDILLPLSQATLANLLSGHQNAVVMPFKIPAQVVRFWLLHDNVLRYLACVVGHDHDLKQDNGCGGHGTWTYQVGQVYELNNPMQEEDMRAEDWVHGRINRYVYFPPAVVSQLLWNLRHALFPDPADEAAAATTPAHPVALSLSSSSPLRRSSRLSTPARRRHGQPNSSPSPLSSHTRSLLPPPSTMPAPLAPARPSHAGKRQHHTQQPAPMRHHPSQSSLVRPSQATTASQASTVDSTPLPLAKTTTAAGVPPVIPRIGGDESSESLVFDDHGGSSIPMPYSGIYSGLDNLEASQLLTKSQILPDSLIQDEEEPPQGRAPDEIWDSEEEEE